MFPRRIGSIFDPVLEPWRTELGGPSRLWRGCVAPAGLWARGRGYGVVFGQWRRRFFLRMLWSRAQNGLWYGEWRWITELDERRDTGDALAHLDDEIAHPEDEIAHIEDTIAPSYRAILSEGPSGVDVPVEVLLLVCEHAIATCYPQKRDSASWLHDWHSSKNKQQLRDLSLVCRATRNLCARAVHRSLVIDAANAAEFVRHMNTGAEAMLEATSTRVESVTKHTKRIILHGETQLWAACVTLASRTLFPHMIAISLRFSHSRKGPKSRCSPFYPPLSPHVLPVLHAVASGISCLQLRSCSFVFSLDLIRLLGSFSSLQDVRLDDVSCMAQGRVASYLSPSPRSTCIDYVLVQNCRCSFDLISALAGVWKVVRSPRCGRFPFGFPGIDDKDLRTIMHISQRVLVTDQSTGDVSGSVHLDSACDATQGWVAWLYYEHVHLEFHLAPAQHADDSSTNRTPAKVRHVVLRIRSFMPPIAQSSFSDFLLDGIATVHVMDILLSQLPALESFVLEAADEALRLSFTDTVNNLAQVGQHLQILGDAAKTRSETCRQAQAHGYHARKHRTHLTGYSRSYADGGSGAPNEVAVRATSPFWFHKDYRDQQDPWLRSIGSVHSNMSVRAELGA